MFVWNGLTVECGRGWRSTHEGQLLTVSVPKLILSLHTKTVEVIHKLLNGNIVWRGAWVQ